VIGADGQSLQVPLLGAEAGDGVGRQPRGAPPARHPQAGNWRGVDGLTQAAAVQAIDAAEARITATETQLRLASAKLSAFRTQLALAERPVSALLAGLAMISERPPILALADRGGVDELVLELAA